MTQYQVDSETMLATTAAARGSIGRLEAEIASLHGQLTNLQSSWTGHAASAFQGVVSEWKGMEQRMQEVLASINHALGQAGQQYSEAEESNARLFSR